LFEYLEEKLKNLIKMTTSTLTSPNNKTSYNSKIYLTPEYKGYLADISDPLTLCFKLMIDYDKPYGLFTDETDGDGVIYTNSALAYLKRIGEDARYSMLKVWIKNFKEFVKNYDFLILNCDGLDEIINKKAGDMFTDADKVTITVRETADMFFQSLLTTYRHIWYDNSRGVEVLPANLRRFDIGILVFNSAYYKMSDYDPVQFKKDHSEYTDADLLRTKIFPTLRKISDSAFVFNSETYTFNHHFIVLGDASINNEESGKGFFDTMNNEPTDDFVKNNLTLNFRFAEYNGMFNNIMGEFNFAKQLAIIAAESRFSNLISESATVTANQKIALQTTTTTKKKQSLGALIGGVATITGKILLSEAKKKVAQVKTKLTNLAKTTVTNAFESIMQEASPLALLQKAEATYVDKYVAKLSSIILTNVPDNLAEALEMTKSKTKNIEVMNQTNKKTGDSIYNETDGQKNSDQIKNQITFGVSNVFTRNKF
jgi:hypothetical protein